MKKLAIAYGISFSLLQVYIVVSGWDVFETFFPSPRTVVYLTIHIAGFAAGILMLFRKKIGSVLFCLASVLEFLYFLGSLLLHVFIFILPYSGGMGPDKGEVLTSLITNAFLVIYLILGIVVVTNDYQENLKESDENVIKIG